MNKVSVPSGTVCFQFSNNDVVEVESYSQLNLLAHAQIVERSLQSRCGGHCECCTCRVLVIEGRVSAMKDDERTLLSKARVLSNDGAPQWRLACQCFPEPGEKIIIEVPSRSFQDQRNSQP